MFSSVSKIPGFFLSILSFLVSLFSVSLSDSPASDSFCLSPLTLSPQSWSTETFFLGHVWVELSLCPQYCLFFRAWCLWEVAWGTCQKYGTHQKAEWAGFMKRYLRATIWHAFQSQYAESWGDDQNQLSLGSTVCNEKIKHKKVVKYRRNFYLTQMINLEVRHLLLEWGFPHLMQD